MTEESPKFFNEENAILRTLIHEWGTKSYEFKLDRLNNIFQDKINNESVFRAHYYFGAKPESESPDALVHLLCYKEYGGSAGILGFLINEIELGEKDDSDYF
ncbi:hypothetical protein B9G53_07140 [Pseudanabaena sp. SR411]|uniref:hypothetical protein n=1 Tax=Pseudanabaena sp. SR411 TaxID=1980935 RepID=UPI000B98906C|nr:hypothetical protein [Pseudanabaena sp. SR411]OYQ65501.1 hypothetical protein B9G53_07140 [Pseudanabaena sp. SR411]